MGLKMIILTFLISLAVQFIVIKISKKTFFGIDEVQSNKPQKFHHVPTPRLGGLGIFIAFVIGIFSINNIPSLSLTVSLLFPFLAGLYEDIKKGVSPKLRLFVISLGAIACIVLLDCIVYDAGLFELPSLIAIPFTVFAVVGVTNAINIIDGFNGLASGIAIIALSSFAVVSYIYEDYFIFKICLLLLSAITGFFVWNFPKGKIFLGDGGAYSIGFLLAVISILLVNRNPQISPWFPIVVLSYPIFETLFSIYRRKFVRGASAFEPDKVHFHTLIYKRIAKSNPKTSVYVWLLVFIFNALAVPFHSNTYILILIFLAFASTYVYLYRSIVKFKMK